MSDEHVDQPQKLTHLDDQGRITMVDVGTKTVSARTAEARGLVLLSPQTIAAIRERRTPKGDPLETARPTHVWLNWDPFVKPLLS